MFKSRTAAVRAAATIGAAALVVQAAPSYADEAWFDGDKVSMPVETGVAFGEVCANTSVERQVALAVQRQGEGQVFQNGSTVTLSKPLTTDSTSLSATYDVGNTIVLPTDWTKQANSYVSDKVVATVKFSAGAAGTSLSAKVSGTASGPNSDTSKKAISQSFSVPVTATVVTCAPKDTTPPNLSLPTSPVIAEATAADGASVTYTATASDNVDGPITPVCTPASGTTFALTTTEVNCSAKDKAGNIATGKFNVTVSDTKAPTFLTFPSDITKEATGSNGAAADFTLPTATDAVDSSPVVKCAVNGTPVAPNETFALGSTTVTCTATDAAKNQVSNSFTVKVQDTTKPEIGQITAPVATEATSGDGAVVNYTAPTATDIVDGSVTVACKPASGSTFAVGSTEVVCSATDKANNTATSKTNILVQDTTKPLLTLPDADVVEEATSADGALVEYTASASDIVDGTVTPVCSPESNTTFPLATTPVLCSAKDKAGNEAKGSFNVKVQDTIRPVLDEMSDLTEEANSKSGATVTFTAPTAFDAVTSGIQVTCASANGLKSGSTFPLGTTTVTCSGKDDAGNEGTETFDVKVQDTTGPALTLPKDLTEEATGPNGAPVSYTATAQDLVDGSVAVVCSPASGTTFGLGSTTVNCTATDAAKNESKGTFGVTVSDTQAPVLTMKSLKVNATSPAGAPVKFEVSAKDTVDTTVSIDCKSATDLTDGSTFPIGATTVDCTATDDSTNSSKGSFLVTVNREFTGFYQPVDTGRTLNAVKSGSTLPLKFNVKAGSTQLTTTEIFTGDGAGLGTREIACGATLPLDDIEQLTSGDTNLRWDSTAGHYIWNWKTPKDAVGKCYQVTVRTNDGASINALFKLK